MQKWNQLYWSIVSLVLTFAGCTLGAGGREQSGWPHLSSEVPSVPSRVSEPADTLIDTAAIDPDIKPCDDFYQYACGNWLKTFTLPGDQPSYTKSFNAIYDRNLETLNVILKAYAAKDYSMPSKDARKLGRFYSSCMNTDEIEKAAPGFVSRHFAEIDSLETKAQLPALVARLQLQGAQVFFNLAPSSDAKDSNSMIAEFSQGGMGLPSREHYLDEKNANIRERYLAYVAKLLMLAGFGGGGRASAEAAASIVLKIETALAQVALRPEELADPQKVYHPTDLATLRIKLPAFDPGTFLNALGLSGLEKINVTEPRFIERVSRLVGETDLESLKIYLKWAWIHSAAPYLGQSLRQEFFGFEKAFLSGAKKMSDRWKECVKSTDSALGEALGEAFVNQTFGEEGKKRSGEMVSRIRQAFKENLVSVEWLDEATRAKAAEKLENILPKIGYPERLRDYDALALGDSFVENMSNAIAFENRRLLDQIGKPVDKALWFMTPQTVNAYYNPSWNEIVFPAGILQSPFFSKLATDGANFGGIGMVIGHELTHGFDSSGRQYDGEGNLIDWWSKSASEAYENKTACMVSQFNHYEVIPGVFLNGKLTLTENIADLGGVKLAYEAFKKSASGRPAMPAVAGFDESQQFFIAFAQGWCTLRTPEMAKLRAQTDTHSDPRFRVNGALANTPAFAEAFGCAGGTAMAPRDRCTLW